MYRENIDKQIASAMKNGDHVRLAVWRSVKTEFVKFQTSGNGIELSDDKEMQIINKMVQQRKDSIEQYTNANRIELATAEQKELDILLSLLPKEPSENDIIQAIDDLITSRNITPTMKDMRDVMTHVKTKYPTVNGGLVSKIFKEKYI
jgi:uncharacterized protein YqeY